MKAGGDDGARDMRRGLMVGGALNHGASTGRWRGRARILALPRPGR
ncbi:hypothetical protein B005_0099 [Nocardiopsis alba ATCC BAA-2165]|uniref:Uncharacterized protein n=1 Tax=Nocardiopsis alba (strain ATCC BAA-2165 / BE74) TaxID=1205910 RepID=J7LCA2_NOCAA|nr:hypothetical protein B005_0099 [Nocardiopsis alba ATCC BAA-2165]